MSSRLKLAGICFAAAFALAACGGGSTATGPAPPTQAELDAAKIAELQGQINALRTQLGLGADDDLSGSVSDLQDELAGLRQQVQDAQDAEDEAARMAMAATAAKLYRGISARVLASVGDATVRDAAYADDNIAVTIGTATAVNLSEDEDTTVATNHGWTGKRYARSTPASDGMYEAVVYSNVEAPKMGRKFGSADTVTPTGAFEYQLTDGALPEASFLAANVAFTGVTRTAGTETFNLPDPNPSGADIILIPGSYHGVSGTYSCTPATPAEGCSAAVAARGFTVSAGDEWSFKPSDANARVRDAADTAYASYGWWLHKTENGATFTASAFTGEVGTVDAATGLDALNGTATYMGGAAGKYALTSATGGTNDAGHFTARATLEANFTPNDGTDTTTNGITGTIDMFIGADGEARDWTVKLNGSPITDTGGIGDTTDGTVWTIGETAGAPAGSWSGTLRNNGTDGVPQVATGTFHATYGTDGGEGAMVGGFGANKQ